jgi:hypothetical protein
MRKTKKPLKLNRETLRHMAAPDELREAAGGVTTPITVCNRSVCIDSCKTCSNCSGRIICCQ